MNTWALVGALVFVVVVLVFAWSLAIIAARADRQADAELDELRAAGNLYPHHRRHE